MQVYLGEPGKAVQRKFHLNFKNKKGFSRHRERKESWGIKWG